MCGTCIILRFRMPATFCVFPELAECISLYGELTQTLLSSGWICSLVHTLAALKGSANAYLSTNLFLPLPR